MKGIGTITEGTEKIDDNELIRKFLKNNDISAFKDLLAKHEQSLERLLYVIFRGSREDMEDVKQDILIELYLKLKHFRFESSFKTYLYRLARNKAIDAVRKFSRERKHLLVLKEMLHENSSDPEEEFLKKEKGQRVLGAVFSLKERDRVLLFLKDVEGFSVVEIAQSMGIPEGTVKSRLHRAREQVADILKESRRKYEK
ncbi:MAG: RNA polymerase sigma factor [Spirochaetales bacterium]|nr:RNA polymerase sigma factor [Spirochaetales bacterium]